MNVLRRSFKYERRASWSFGSPSAMKCAKMLSRTAMRAIKSFPMLVPDGGGLCC